MNKYLFLWVSGWLLCGCQQTPNEPINSLLSDSSLAQIAFNGGDYHAATRLYQQALASTDVVVDRPQIYLDIARAYRRLKQPDTALRFLNKIEKPTALSYQLMGRCQLDKQQYTLAEHAFEQALSLNDQAVVSFNGLAVALSWQGKYQASEAVFVKALSFSPDNTRYLGNRALNLIMLGQSPLAIDLLTPIYRRGQSNAKTRGYLALALLIETQEDKARSVLSQDYFATKLDEVVNYLTQFATQKETMTPHLELTP